MNCFVNTVKYSSSVYKLLGNKSFKLYNKSRYRSVLFVSIYSN